MDQENIRERRDSGAHDITSPEQIVYDHNGSVEIVRAGTLPALVEHLTRHDKLDASFNRTFLTTYKYFTSGTVLLKLLISRFDCSPPITLNPAQAAEWSTQTKPLIRLRVIYILRQWLEHFWTELEGSDTEQILLTLRSFVERATAAIETRAVQQLLEVIQRRLAGVVPTKISQPSVGNPPKPILPRKLDKLQFLKIDAKEIARQLTIMEAHMFGKLQLDEFLNKNWQKKESSVASERAPNVRALIRYFNQLCNWVGALILAESDLKKRAQVIGHWVNVASVKFSLMLVISTAVSLIFTNTTDMSSTPKLLRRDIYSVRSGKWPHLPACSHVGNGYRT